MSATQPDDPIQEDLIDNIVIVADLPPDLRARYYRLIMHCRSLPQNDEMLRVLNILQILTFLIQKAPATVVAERKRIEALVEPLIETLEKVIRSNHEYLAQLQQGLAQLPQDIAAQIHPKAIAGAIQESLRQELIRSGVPQTGQMMQSSMGDLTRAIREFLSGIQELRESHKAAARDVRDVSANIVRTSNQAVDQVRAATAHLSRQYQWPLYVLGSVVIIVAFLLGARYQRWLDSPAEPDVRPVAPIVKPTPPAPPNVRQKTRQD